MRNSYEATYRCPMCGEVLGLGSKVMFAYDDMPEVLAKVIKNQQFVGTQLYQFPIQVPHQCTNGDGGLATFCGFRDVRNNKPPKKKLFMRKR